MNKEKITYIINGYLYNNLPNHLQTIFRKWLLEPSNSKEKESVLKDVFDNIDPEYDEKQIEEGLTKIHEDLSLSLSGYKRSNRKWIWAVAASIMVAMLLFAEWYFMSRANEDGNTLIYITAAQSKGEFVLPDGSKVYLNGSSRLECPETFGDNERKVKLDGEGYFDVKHGDIPFIVDTKKISVKVLGTAFDVKCYNDKNLSQVVLHRGSVLMQTKEDIPQIVKLNINQKAEFNNEGGQINVYDVCSDYYISWIYKRLVFDNEKLSDIIVSLQRWYNIDFDIAPDTDLDYRLSFVVRNEAVDEVLSNISKVTPLNIAKHNETFIISQRK